MTGKYEQYLEHKGIHIEKLLSIQEFQALTLNSYY